MNNEKKYPIYSFDLRWSEDGKQDEKYPIRFQGLPKNRIWNSTGFSKMFKEEKTEKELNAFIADWWDKYSKTEKVSIKNPMIGKLESEFKEFETWHCTWFQHETFDIGQTDEEALKSFEDFVSRKQSLNERSQYEKGEDVYCLMGAEDRWRWHGLNPDAGTNEHVPAPCRCKHCKEAGLIRIAH